MNNEKKILSQKIRDLGRFGDIGNEPEEERLQHFFLITMGVLMSIGGLSWGAICSFYGLFFQSLIPFGYVGLTFINLTFFAFTKKIKPVRFFQVLISLLLPFLFQWVLGGFVASGAVMLWSLLALVGSFTFSNSKTSLRWLSIFLVLTIGSGFIDPFLGKITVHVSSEINTVFFVGNIFSVSTIVICLMVYLFSKLEERTNDLRITLISLKETQAQLIQSEKMASLGELVANVAHEINTPIGAVKASGMNIENAIDRTLENLPKLFQILDSETRELFLRLIRKDKVQLNIHSSKEERAFTKLATQKLEEFGIEYPRNIAEILVQLNIQESISDYLPLLLHPEKDFIFMIVRNIGTVVNSTSNINLAVEKVSKIIFALKSFSHVSQKDEMVLAQLKEGIEIVLTIYQNQLKQGIEVIRNQEEIPPVKCFPDELNQVWTNLIHNAIQAMNNQGTLTIGIHQSGNEAIVSFADTGSGITEAIREKIFDPFFTTKRAGEGSGLGLGIAKKIIERHNGRIEVKSQVGIGSEFIVYLPFKGAVT